MSSPDIEFSGPQFRPPPIAPDKPRRTGSSTPGTVPKAAQAHARMPFYLLAIINFIFFTVDYVPEVLKLPPAGVVLGQVRPLTTTLAARGAGFAHENGAAMWALVFAALLAAAAYTPLRHIALAVWALAGGLVVSLLISVLPPLLHSWSAVATSGVLLLVIAGYAVAAARALPKTAPGNTMPRITSGWIVLYLLTAAGPLAVGRLLRGGAFAVAATKSVHPDKTLIAPSTWWFYLVGASAGLAVWAIVQLIPPWSGRKITWPIIVLVVTIGGGLAMAGDIASSYAVVKK